MTQETHPIVNLSQADLDAMLHRALRNTLILGMIAALAVLIGGGWRSAGLLVTGTLISAASIWEWQRMVRVINARLDKQKTPASAPVVVLFFVLRLTVFAGVIYVSLKFLHGSVFALFFGVGLAALNLVWESIRLLRD
ncbi:MAG: ATP synthase subunit I [Terracidiphilus sp.]